MLLSQSAFAKNKSARLCKLPRALESCICQEKAPGAKGEARGDAAGTPGQGDVGRPPHWPKS